MNTYKWEVQLQSCPTGSKDSTDPQIQYEHKRWATVGL